MKNYPASKVTDKGKCKPYAILKIIRKEDPKIINLEYFYFNQYTVKTCVKRSILYVLLSLH